MKSACSRGNRCPRNPPNKAGGGASSPPRPRRSTSSSTTPRCSSRVRRRTPAHPQERRADHRQGRRGRGLRQRRVEAGADGVADLLRLDGAAHRPQHGDGAGAVPRRQLGGARDQADEGGREVSAAIRTAGEPGAALVATLALGPSPRCGRTRRRRPHRPRPPATPRPPRSARPSATSKRRRTSGRRPSRAPPPTTRPPRPTRCPPAAPTCGARATSSSSRGGR